MKALRSIFKHRNSRRASASVEMAIVAPILAYMMLGIVEIGLMVNSFMQVRTVAREGAREAAVGRSNTEIANRIAAIAVSLDATEMTTTIQYRTYSSGTWSAWQTLTTDSTGRNIAPAGSHVRVLVNYNHHLAMPGIFGCLATDDAGETKTLSTTVVMRRE